MRYRFLFTKNRLRYTGTRAILKTAKFFHFLGICLTFRKIVLNRYTLKISNDTKRRIALTRLFSWLNFYRRKFNYEEYYFHISCSMLYCLMNYYMIFYLLIIIYQFLIFCPCPTASHLICTNKLTTLYSNDFSFLNFCGRNLTEEPLVSYLYFI